MHAMNQVVHLWQTCAVGFVVRSLGFGAALQTNGAVRTIVRKKAALCLLRLLRKSPQDQEIMVPDVWSVKLVSTASTRPFFRVYIRV